MARSKDSSSSTKTFRYQEVFVIIWSEGQVEGQGGAMSFGFDVLRQDSMATG